MFYCWNVLLGVMECSFLGSGKMLVVFVTFILFKILILASGSIVVLYIVSCAISFCVWYGYHASTNMNSSVSEFFIPSVAFLPLFSGRTFFLEVTWRQTKCLGEHSRVTPKKFWNIHVEVHSLTFDVDIEERRRSLVHSVLISLASPESMENLRIESTLETFAMEVTKKNQVIYMGYIRRVAPNILAFLLPPLYYGTLYSSPFFFAIALPLEVLRTNLAGVRRKGRCGGRKRKMLPWRTFFDWR